MNRTDFTTAATRDGYTEILDRELPANKQDGEHRHEFDARLLITAGEFTVTMNGAPRTWRAGETFEVPAGTPHAELCGDAPVRYTVARRYKAA
jgi:quercetin dioxygenase-like cupin family protein